MSTENSQKSNMLAIGIMFMLFFMIAFVTNFAGSMGIIVKEQFQASNALSQLGSAANFCAYFFMGIPGGLILKRKGYKFTALLAVGIGIAGVGVQLASGYVSSFAVYVTGAFIAGFSMCLLNLVVNPLLNTLGGGGNKGNQLVQFGCSLNSIGATLAPVILGYLIGGEVAKAKVADAAPALMIAMGIFVIAFLVLAFSAIPEPHLETAEEKANRTPVLKDIAATLKFRHFTLGALAIFTYIVIESGIPNMANLYMTDVHDVKGSETEITGEGAKLNAEATQITTDAFSAKFEQVWSAWDAGEKAAAKAKAEKADEMQARAEAEKEAAKASVLKPGDKQTVIKWQKEGSQEWEQLKPGDKLDTDQIAKAVEAEKGDKAKIKANLLAEEIKAGSVVSAESKGAFKKVVREAGIGYIGPAIAGTVVAVYWFCMMLGRLLGGALGGKVSSRMQIAVCSSLGIVLMLVTMFLPVKMVTLFGMQFPVAMIFMALCGLCTSVMWGGIFNMAAEGLGKYVPMGSGIFMAMVVGGLMLPVQGLVADAIGILNSYWFTIGLLAYVLFYALIGSRVSKRAE